jgi:hypothetical protein
LREQERLEVRDLDALRFGLGARRIRERQIRELLVVTVELSVGCGKHQAFARRLGSPCGRLHPL